MTILHYIFIAVEVIVLFNLIIGVHELGHFLAAKWRGLKIDRFAIWFGKPIWKRKIGGVEYALGWIPAGGYVALPQMAPMEMIEGKSETSGKQSTDVASLRSGDLVSLDTAANVSALDKIIVAFAGPLFSVLLAFAFAVIVWKVGKPSDQADNTTQIGWVVPGGPAAAAGLRAGDTILEVDGHPVKNFLPTGNLDDSIKWRVITSTGTNIAIEYQRDGVVATAYAVPTNLPTKWYERRSLREIAVGFAQKTVLGDLASNSPAAVAGLRSGDEIVAIDGRKIFSPAAVLTAQQDLTNGPNNPMTFTVVRDGKTFSKTLLAVKPVSPTNSPLSFGFVSLLGDTNVLLVYPGPWQQVQASATQIFSTIGALFEPKGQIGVQQLGGAVMIIRVYSNLFADVDNGWRRVLWFSVVLNVNLALINMLPLPVLDGGHILLSLIEVIRRRPIGPRLLNTVQSAFMVLLISFMLYIAFFDAGDWFRSSHGDREEPVVFAPANVHALPDSGTTITIPAK